MLKDEQEDFQDGSLPWERGYYGTTEGERIGLPDGSYEVVGDGCYRRMPVIPE
jgi:hypothetical protein